jgi:hypothetical protein
VRFALWVVTSLREVGLAFALSRPSRPRCPSLASNPCGQCGFRFRHSSPLSGEPCCSVRPTLGTERHRRHDLCPFDRACRGCAVGSYGHSQIATVGRCLAVSLAWHPSMTASHRLLSNFRSGAPFSARRLASMSSIGGGPLVARSRFPGRGSAASTTRAARLMRRSCDVHAARSR